MQHVVQVILTGLLKLAGCWTWVGLMQASQSALHIAYQVVHAHTLGYLVQRIRTVCAGMSSHCQQKHPPATWKPM